MDGSVHVAARLTELAQPFMARNDWQGFAVALNGRFSADCLELLLNHADPAVARLAATACGLVGTIRQSEALARLLHHDSPGVAGAAEDALWSLWFRAGGSDSLRIIRKAQNLIDERMARRAIPLLDSLIAGQPNFAEAYHQRSIAHFLLGEYESSRRDAERATRLNRWHFAAWACQGNCHAEADRLEEALECFREAMRIHPRLDAVRESVREIRALLVQRADVAS
ncbi:MAG: tetratricopeptide repeat protein [Phycisphaerae bacterium]|nr:tetratricopeptide repeat protein [Phycisphaerae bacterium]